ncbi:MAG TPA: PH domain-containing protein [Vicinamibacterales bacterium]|nr:PH domain-containing protein [Vicinamibacterales bacterium]
MADSVEAPPPSVADGELHALDPQYVVVQRLAAAIASTVVMTIATLGMLITAFGAPGALWWQLPAWVAGAVFFVWWTIRWPPLDYAHARYRVDAVGLEIRRGVWWREVTSVPKSRVQHTDVSQGPIERRFGIGTLVIYTAGTDHARVELPGLPYARALAIRDHLLPAGGDDAV